jgi:UDP-perosamine 4-acetyltransferase
MISNPIIIIGAGGHAKVLIDALQRQSANIIGVTDSNPEKKGENILGVPVIGNDEIIMTYENDFVKLVNAIGRVSRENKREQIFKSFKCKRYKFAHVIHNTAVLSSDVKYSEGVQIMAGSVIQPGCKIGTNSIINTGAIIDHDTFVGAHVHIAPGVTISGGVQISDGSLVGVGATIIQGIKIGANCIVAAGSVVIRDVPDGAIVMGIPAKPAKMVEQ